MNETIQKIAAILQSGEVLSSDRARALGVEAGRRLVEAQIRLEQIRPQSATEGTGHERKQLMLVGGDTRALDAEWEQVRLHAETLEAQRNEMSRLRIQARNREASEGLPALVKTLEKHVAKVEAAIAALVEARAGLKAVHNQVTEDRGIARSAGLQCASVPPAVIERLLVADPSYDRHRDVTRERLGDSRIQASMGFAA